MRLAWVLCAGAMIVGSAHATNVPITGLKLIVVDKTVAAGQARAAFVAKDPAITKGDGTDPSQIQSTLRIKYDGTAGTFDLPTGGNWLRNTFLVSKYVNTAAPSGGAAKVGVIKRNLLTKVVGKDLGDEPLDISSPPSGSVYVAQTIVNGPQVRALCTRFDECAHQPIANGTGYKLVCTGNSVPDASCQANCTAAGPCGPGDGCLTGVCDALTGECGKQPDGTPCDDGQPCTEDEFCANGTCNDGHPTFCPPNPDNLCLPTWCDPMTGACADYQIECPPPPTTPVGDCYENICFATEGICKSSLLPIHSGLGDPCEFEDACQTTADCADNDACTIEVCAQDGAVRICKYPALDCDDGNPCTDDFCDPPVGCVYKPLNPALDCDDGVACTITSCVNGVGCHQEASDAACEDDEDPCTAVPHCDAVNGCVYPSACDDGDPCTQDVCTVDAKDGVSCSYVALNCSTP